MLLGAKTPKEDTAHQLALTLISYIGVGISLAGTFFTLISYIIFPYVYLDLNEYVACMICSLFSLCRIILRMIEWIFYHYLGQDG